MKIKKLSLAMSAVLLFCMLFPHAMAHAEAVDFYVKAMIPDNQVDTHLSYFDLLVQPGQEQALVVQIYNEGKEELLVQVSAISASTNYNGVIDYKTPDICDESLIMPFSEIASVQQEFIAVAPGSMAKAVIALHMPEEAFNGVTLGGIVIKKLNGEDMTQAQDANPDFPQNSGVGVQNVFSYVVGVVLHGTGVEEVKPDFEALEATVGLINARVAVQHYIRNMQPAIAKNVKLEISIYSENKKETVRTAEALIDVAPNSVLPYAVFWDEPIDPGKYISYVSMEWMEQTWSFAMPFEVLAEEAAQINAASVEQPKAQLPTWQVVLIILLIVLLTTAVILLFILLFKKRKTDKSNTGA